MKTIVIDGDKFHDVETFQAEMIKLFAPDQSFVRLSLDGFNDALRGGFGVFSENEQVTIIWRNHEKSKKDLGYTETTAWLEQRLPQVHPDNKSGSQQQLIEAKASKGPTYYDRIIEIITSAEHQDRITLVLQ